jgi:prolyl oligopeptidase
MKQLLKISCLAILFFSCEKEPEKKPIIVTYPETQQKEVVDTYFDTEVKDPYRWLEDDSSKETEAWVKEQNKTTYSYLDSIPFREALKKRYTKLINYEKISAPRKRGQYEYFYKNDGLQNQYVIYRQKEDEKAEVFLDPNKFSEDGTVSMGSGLSFSDNKKTVAYAISEGGSDWRKIVIMDVASKEVVEDTLVDVKFSGISWKENDGFYYSSYDKPKGSELSEKTDQHKLYYHKLGTSQKEDKVIYGATEAEKHRYVGGGVTEDGNYLFIYPRVSTSGTKLLMKDLTKPDSKIVTILDNTNTDSYVIENVGSKLYIMTNMNAPNQKIVTVDASNPAPENWVDFIPETKNVLSISTGSGYFFAEYMVDAVSKVVQYDYDGKLVRDVKLPGVGSAGGFSGEKDDKILYFSFSNYKTPGTTYTYNPKDGTSKVYRRPGIDFNPDEYESKQVFYKSKDGTKVPMIITHKKGIKMDGKNPTILYAYGGFNVSLTPSFSVANVVWMEQGGIYAVAHRRGGG